MRSIARFLLPLALLSACDLLVPPPGDDGSTRRSTRDECEEDRDCDGGEVCDNGECVAIGEGEGEGEGEPPPPPPPVCGEVGCPEILSFSANRTTLGSFDSATLSAVVTDPDGVADLLGGVLIDPVTDTTYGTFTATGAGTFSVSVDWGLLGTVRAVDFATSTTRVVRGRFFDQAGHAAFADVTLTLRCDGGEAACEGSCGRERCGGSCVAESTFTSNTNCGGCGVRCTAPASCEPDVNEDFRCVGGGGGEGEGEPSAPYSGTREPGVVCGVAGTCNVGDTCCIDLVNTEPTCTLQGTCIGLGGSCDGPEDCASGTECCFSTFSSSCTPTGECRTNNNSEVCVTNADCVAGELCCTNTSALLFGLDAGACLVAVAGQCP